MQSITRGSFAKPIVMQLSCPQSHCLIIIQGLVVLPMYGYMGIISMIILKEYLFFCMEECPWESPMQSLVDHM